MALRDLDVLNLIFKLSEDFLQKFDAVCDGRWTVYVGYVWTTNFVVWMLSVTSLMSWNSFNIKWIVAHFIVMDQLKKAKVSFCCFLLRKSL